MKTYKISDVNKMKIEEYLQFFYVNIEDKYDKCVLNVNYFPDILLAISDGMEYIKTINKYEKFKEIGYNICKYIKNDIESRDVEDYNIGMFVDVGYMCFCIDVFTKKYKILENFNNKFKDFFVEKTVEVIKKLDYENIEASDYDVIFGLSGCLNYMLSNIDMKKHRDVVLFLRDSLYRLLYNEINENFNFVIYKDNQTSVEREEPRYRNGLIDIGMAHGILGPALALLKTLNIEENDKIKNFILEIVSIYAREDLFFVYNGIKYWPGKVSIEEFNGETDIKYHNINSSWCYGVTSINTCLHKVHERFRNIHRAKDVFSEIKKISDLRMEEHYLSSTCICHGYSGVLSYMTYTNEKYGILNNDRLNECLEELFKLEHEKEIENKDKTMHEFYNDLEAFEGNRRNLSMLEGSTGIALSLLSLLYDQREYRKLLLWD